MRAFLVAMLLLLSSSCFALPSIRIQAECGARAGILEGALQAHEQRKTAQEAEAYLLNDWAPKLHLRKKAGKALIHRTVEYVYQVEQYPYGMSLQDISDAAASYRRHCQFSPREYIGDVYVVQLSESNN